MLNSKTMTHKEHDPWMIRTNGFMGNVWADIQVLSDSLSFHCSLNAHACL